MRITKLKLQMACLCALAASPAVPKLTALTIAPTGGDDTAAIQAALGAGGAVTLSGTLKISKTLTPANGARLTGGQLAWTGPVNSANTYALSFSGNGLSISGVTFNGAGANLSGASNVSFSGNTIENIPGGTPFGVYFGSLTSSTIDANTFSNISAVGAIMGYNAAGSHFDANTIANCYQGMHILWNNASGNCTVSCNNVYGFTRHGIELQGDPQGLTVHGNIVHDPAAAGSHIWLSVATGGETTRSDNATGVVIDGNACTAPAGFAANPPINYCGIEAMGNGTKVTSNFVAGVGWGGLYTANPNMTWSNNQYHAVGAGVPCTAEPGNPVAPVIQAHNPSDNIWSGALPPAIAAAVGPAAMPAVNAAPAPVVTLLDNHDGSITATWNDPTNGTVHPTLSLAPTNGAAAMTVQLGSLPVGVVSAKIGAIPANWVVTLTVAYPGAAAGSASASIQATGGPTPAASNAWNPALLFPPATQPASTQLTTPPTKTVSHVITVYSDGSISSN